MNFLVTDLECTCSNTDEFPRDEMEVIEIGAYLLDNELNVIGTYEKFVKPEQHVKLTDFCKELTTIKQEDIDTANIFSEEIFKFVSWAKEHGDFAFVSWGGFDARQIKREAKRKGLDNPLDGIQCINYMDTFKKKKNLYKKRSVGLGYATKILNLEFQGTHHRGIDDAHNISEIIKKVGF